MLYNVHLLSLIAALLVVYFHSTLPLLTIDVVSPLFRSRVEPEPINHRCECVGHAVVVVFDSLASSDESLPACDSKPGA